MDAIFILNHAVAWLIFGTAFAFLFFGAGFGFAEDAGERTAELRSRPAEPALRR